MCLCNSAGMMPSTPFSHLNLSCHASKCCAPCDCSDAEIAIRHYASPRQKLPAMSPKQRNWCVAEILRFQPEQSAAELMIQADDQLARSVIKAWNRSVRF